MKIFFDFLVFLFILYSSRFIEAQLIANSSFETSTIVESDSEYVVKRSPSKEVVDIDVNSQINSREKRRSRLGERGITLPGKGNEGRRPGKGNEGWDYITKKRTRAPKTTRTPRTKTPRTPKTTRTRRPGAKTRRPGRKTRRSNPRERRF
uniref:Uncharacterized protein n=1 Tax=Strongyloides papillosus TaxID=174720 RepID=A0A0N5BQD0_STREA